MTLIAALYMGGIANPLDFFGKTLLLLVILSSLHAILTRLRIDQTVGLWWRYGAVVVLPPRLLPGPPLLGGLEDGLVQLEWTARSVRSPGPGAGRKRA